MKRLAIWAFYGVGALAIGYLALYAYAVFTGRDLQPGDPIHIFRKPDAPSYSALSTSLRGVAKQSMVRNCAPVRSDCFVADAPRNDGSVALTPPSQTAGARRRLRA